MDPRVALGSQCASRGIAYGASASPGMSGGGKFREGWVITRRKLSSVVGSSSLQRILMTSLFVLFKGDLKLNRRSINAFLLQIHPGPVHSNPHGHQISYDVRPVSIHIFGKLATEAVKRPLKFLMLGGTLSFLVIPPPFFFKTECLRLLLFFLFVILCSPSPHYCSSPHSQTSSSHIILLL